MTAEARSNPSENARPFERWPNFRKRGEACAWVLKMFPNAPEWLALEVAGDPEIWRREVVRLCLDHEGQTKNDSGGKSSVEAATNAGGGVGAPPMMGTAT